MTLAELASPQQGYSYAFLDEFAKRELRRRVLKAIAIPGYQVPYASRELPIARGWGTGGLQVTLAMIGPLDVIKVIDQGADDSVNTAENVAVKGLGQRALRCLRPPQIGGGQLAACNEALIGEASIILRARPQVMFMARIGLGLQDSCAAGLKALIFAKVDFLDLRAEQREL